MKFIFNNKMKFITLLLFVLLLSVIGVYMFCTTEFFFKYKTYSSYGEMVESEESKDLVINAFLKATEEKGNKVCLQLIEISEELEKFNICFQKEFLNWENPYEDYSKLIPVKVVFDFEEIMFGIFSLCEVRVTLLEDSEYMGVLYSMDEERIKDFQVRIKSNEEIVSRGYYTKELGDAFGVIIIDALIYEVSSVNEKIEVGFKAIIQGENISSKILVDELVLGTVDDSGEPIRTTINKDNINLLKTGIPATIALKIPGDIDVDKYMREKFVNLEKTSELNFEYAYISLGEN